MNDLEVNEKVNHPSHYNQVPSIECIDVVEHFNMNLGNAIKYIWRHSNKQYPIEDLKKAIWYIEREIARIKICVSNALCPFCKKE